MKISGYSDQGLPIEGIRPMELAEITINATPDEARKIAAFLISVADAMDQMGNAYSHMHLADQQSGFEDSPHITVFNSKIVE